MKEITFVDSEHREPAVRLVYNLITVILNLVPMQTYMLNITSGRYVY